MAEDDWGSVMHAHLKGHSAPSHFAAVHWRTQAKAGKDVYVRRRMSARWRCGWLAQPPAMCRETVRGVRRRHWTEKRPRDLGAPIRGERRITVDGLVQRSGEFFADDAAAGVAPLPAGIGGQ